MPEITIGKSVRVKLWADTESSVERTRTTIVEGPFGLCHVIVQKDENGQVIRVRAETLDPQTSRLEEDALGGVKIAGDKGLYVSPRQAAHILYRYRTIARKAKEPFFSQLEEVADTIRSWTEPDEGVAEEAKGKSKARTFAGRALTI